MRLPEARTTAGRARAGRALKGLFDTLITDPFCNLFPNTPGCSDRDPPPPPTPDPSPAPEPPATAPSPSPQPTVETNPTFNQPPPQPPAQPPQQSAKPDNPDPPAAPKPPPTTRPGSDDSQDSSSDSGSSGPRPESPDSNPGRTSPGSGSSGSGDTGSNAGSGTSSGGTAVVPTPTKGGAETTSPVTGGDGNDAGSGHQTGLPKPAGNSLQVTSPDQDQEDGTRSTPAAESGLGKPVATGAPEMIQDGLHPTQTIEWTPEGTGSSMYPGTSVGFDSSQPDGIPGTPEIDSGNYPNIGTGTMGSGSPTITGTGRGGSATEDDHGPGDSLHTSSVPGIIVGVVALLVLFLVLFALLLYRYRHTPRVQAFLAKYTPFKILPYTKSDKKRSSMGDGLLFSDGQHGDALMNEKTSAFGYGTILPAPVTQPNPAVSRPQRADAPPPLVITTASKRSSSPVSPFEVSPLSGEFPASPAPAIPRRSSQDSMGGVSIASSGILSPSLLSWPLPPSSAPTPRSSPPTTSHGYLNNMTDRYQSIE